MNSEQILALCAVATLLLALLGALIGAIYWCATVNAKLDLVLANQSTQSVAIAALELRVRTLEAA